jgi:hypothetical protein
MMHWADAAWMLAIAAAGSAASYILVLRRVRHTVLEHQREIERRLSTLTEAITLLETRLAEPEASTDSLSAQEIEAETNGEGTPPALWREPDEIPTEIQVAIAAVALAVLGPHARVRSARVVHNAVSPWSQQGRVSVQSSHNLRVRR